MDLKSKIKELPSSPGVYLMKDSLNNIIYVGKSKNLKNRVGSYFYNSTSHSPKTLKLIKNIKDLEYILTDTEFEALLLECKLIHELKPAYNRLMKSPNSYNYIHLKMNDKFVDIRLSSDTKEENGSLYFGPYTSKNTTEKAIQAIKESFKILCLGNSKKSSSCLNYSLGLCIGMCLDDFPMEKSIEIMNHLINLLNGTDKSILTELEEKMNTASSDFNFEKAAIYRDHINSISHLFHNAKVVEFTKKSKNIALIEYLDEKNIKFFLIKGNNLLFSQKYSLTDCDLEMLKLNLKTKVVENLIDGSFKKSTSIKKDELDEAQIIYSFLRKKSNNCKYVVIPKKHLKNENTLDKLINKLFV